MDRRPLLLAALLLALAPPGQAQEHGLAARVNGRPITRQRLERFLEDYAVEKGRSVTSIWTPEPLKRLRKEALDQLIQQELLWQDCEKKKIVASPEEVDAALGVLSGKFKTREAYLRRLERGGFDEKQYAEFVKRQLSIRRLVEKEVTSGVAVSDEEIHALYESRPDLFQDPPQVHARHILVKVEEGASPAARQKARRQADRILAMARKKGADFGELARKHSQDGSAPSGGDLGFFGRAQMLKPFEEAAFALEPGQLSGVVETAYGFHVIQCLERRGGGRIPEAAARDQIRQKIFAQKSAQGLDEKVEVLKKAARIEIDASLQ